MRGTNIWLAWRELEARRWRLVATGVAVAAAVALVSATELVCQAREVAVASEIDYLGPSLRVVPAGVTSMELARFELGETLMPDALVLQLRSELAGWVRGLGGRLLLSEPVDGIESPIIGMLRGRDLASVMAASILTSGGVTLGADLARELEKQPGQRVEALGRTWRIDGVLPPLGGVEDSALLMHLAALQKARGGGETINEIYIHVRPDVPLSEVTEWLGERHPELSVFGGTDRDRDVEAGTLKTLSAHRAVVYVFTGIAAAIVLMITAYINASERRTEMATIVALGGTTASVLVALVARAIIIGALGGTTGYTLGAVIALVQDPAAAAAVVQSWVHPLGVITSATLLSGAAALPVCALVACQDHVRAFQE